jgi:hypothetical protein
MTMRNAKAGLRSTNTTVMGILTIAVALLQLAMAYFDGDAATTPDLAVLGAQIAIGWGLINARDAGRSSEESGVNGFRS